MATSLPALPLTANRGDGTLVSHLKPRTSAFLTVVERGNTRHVHHLVADAQGVVVVHLGKGLRTVRQVKLVAVLSKKLSAERRLDLRPSRMHKKTLPHST